MSASRIYVEVAEGGVVCLLPKLALTSPPFWKGRMSALGQKQTFALHYVMSALHPKADIRTALAHVCFVPIADFRRQPCLDQPM